MMKSLACLIALLTLTVPAFAATGTLLQPQSGEGDLQLEVSEGRASLLRANGQRLRLPLRRGELIEELVEFDGGWAAAGVRAVGNGRQLAVVVDGAAGIERLRPVPRQVGNYRVKPVPMSSDSGFEGLAWLEGDSPASYEVRVADWSGADWSPSVTVSAARRGGQAGLVGTVLDDGRWLLVWSASDGRGSELFWSIRQGNRWTSPRRLSALDRAPDVTPTLLRVAGGALLAWAHQQTDGYGLQTARFTDRWTAPQRLGGSGGWSPRFAELADSGRFLVHRSPNGWTAVEIDSGGRALRRAVIDSDRRERPILTTPAGGFALRWERGGRTRQLQWERSQ